MSTPMAIAVYFTMWWIVLFAILPWGVRSQHESGDWQAGTDPGAPIAPKLAVKALATTVVSAILFAAFWAYIEYAP
jgi:predicted secreted protein